MSEGMKPCPFCGLKPEVTDPGSDIYMIRHREGCYIWIIEDERSVNSIIDKNSEFGGAWEERIRRSLRTSREGNKTNRVAD
jgi:hypothetical protein